MATDVEVPVLGESITEGTLAQWLKQPGDAVKADEPIAELETDKVSVEVPSPVAGVLAEQLVKQGDTVAVGAPIARIDESGSAAAATPAKAAADASTNPAGAGETPALRGDETAPVAEAEPDDHITTLSPAVRRAPASPPSTISWCRRWACCGGYCCWARSRARTRSSRLSSCWAGWWRRGCGRGRWGAVPAKARQADLPSCSVTGSRTSRDGKPLPCSRARITSPPLRPMS